MAGRVVLGSPPLSAHARAPAIAAKCRPNPRAWPHESAPPPRVYVHRSPTLWGPPAKATPTHPNTLPAGPCYRPHRRCRPHRQPCWARMRRSRPRPTTSPGAAAAGKRTAARTSSHRRTPWSTTCGASAFKWGLAGASPFLTWLTGSVGWAPSLDPRDPYTAHTMGTFRRTMSAVAYISLAVPLWSMLVLHGFPHKEPSCHVWAHLSAACRLMITKLKGR